MCIRDRDTPAFDGVTYDKTKYTVTVTLEDDGQGHLTPNAEISGGEDGSIVLKNELARRNLTISKTTAGNKVLSDDAFTVKIRLSRNDIVPVDGDYPMDGAAETTLTVKNGEATLTIRDGQTVTIKEIPVLSLIHILAEPRNVVCRREVNGRIRHLRRRAGVFNQHALLARQRLGQHHGCLLYTSRCV